MFLNQTPGQPEFSVVETVVLCQFDFRFHPELGFTTPTVDMYVHFRLFSGDEKEAKSSVSENRGTRSLFVILESYLTV